MSPILNSLGSLAARAFGFGTVTTAPFSLTGSYDALATVIVPSGGVSTITFAGIPTGYKHLQLLTYAQTNRTDYDIANWGIQFNGDSGSNYSRHSTYLFSTLSSDNVTSQTRIIQAGAGASSSTTSNVFGASVIDIFDYSSVTKNKTIRSLGGANSNYTSSYFGIISSASGAWYNASTAINTITCFPIEGTLWNAESRFELYGVK